MVTFDIACVICGPSRPTWPDMQDHMKDGRVMWIDNEGNERSPCECYQDALEDSEADILIYMHSDLDIIGHHWLEITMGQFACSDQVVAVGLGGATSLGNKDLYRKPYVIDNMARSGYASNQVDAEVHGQRFTGIRKVAVLDAFFMAVRTDFLLSVGGWPHRRLTHHCLDLWLACETARRGKEIWMVGAECNHRGGAASIGSKYAEAKWLIGGSTESDHKTPHLWLWDTYRDVLPIDVSVTNVP